jgi:hypothetical protein
VQRPFRVASPPAPIRVAPAAEIKGSQPLNPALAPPHSTQGLQLVSMQSDEARTHAVTNAGATVQRVAAEASGASDPSALGVPDMAVAAAVASGVAISPAGSDELTAPSPPLPELPRALSALIPPLPSLRALSASVSRKKVVAMFASPLVMYRPYRGAPTEAHPPGSLEVVPLGLHPLDYPRERRLIYEALQSASGGDATGGASAKQQRNVAAAAFSKLVRQLSSNSALGVSSADENAATSEALANLLPLLPAPFPMLTCHFLSASSLRHALTQARFSARA